MVALTHTSSTKDIHDSLTDLIQVSKRVSSSSHMMNNYNNNNNNGNNNNNNGNNNSSGSNMIRLYNRQDGGGRGGDNNSSQVSIQDLPVLMTWANPNGRDDGIRNLAFNSLHRIEKESLLKKFQETSPTYDLAQRLIIDEEKKSIEEEKKKTTSPTTDIVKADEKKAQGSSSSNDSVPTPKLFELILEKDIYFTGDVIKGFLVLRTSSTRATRCQGIRIHLQGTGYGSMEIMSKNEEVYTGSRSHSYCNSKRTIMGNIHETVVHPCVGQHLFFGPPWAPDDGTLYMGLPSPTDYIIIRIMKYSWLREDEVVAETAIRIADSLEKDMVKVMLYLNGRRIERTALTFRLDRDQSMIHRDLDGKDEEDELLGYCLTMIKLSNLAAMGLNDKSNIYIQAYPLLAIHAFNGLPFDQPLPSPKSLEIELQPDSFHAIPFSFQLANDLPSSHMDLYTDAFIAYSIYAVIEGEESQIINQIVAKMNYNELDIAEEPEDVAFFPSCRRFFTVLHHYFIPSSESNTLMIQQKKSFLSSLFSKSGTKQQQRGENGQGNSARHTAAVRRSQSVGPGQGQQSQSAASASLVISTEKRTYAPGQMARIRVIGHAQRHRLWKAIIVQFYQIRCYSLRSGLQSIERSLIHSKEIRNRKKSSSSSSSSSSPYEMNEVIEILIPALPPTFLGESHADNPWMKKVADYDSIAQRERAFDAFTWSYEFVVEVHDARMGGLFTSTEKCVLPVIVNSVDRIVIDYLGKTRLSSTRIEETSRGGVNYAALLAEERTRQQQEQQLQQQQSKPGVVGSTSDEIGPPGGESPVITIKNKGSNIVESSSTKESETDNTIKLMRVSLNDGDDTRLSFTSTRAKRVKMVPSHAKRVIRDAEEDNGILDETQLTHQPTYYMWE
eukprot:gene10619-11767_t